MQVTGKLPATLLEARIAPDPAAGEYGRFPRDKTQANADLRTWAGRIGSQGWSEAYVFFRREHDGTAPRSALRLLWIAGA